MAMLNMQEQIAAYRIAMDQIFKEHSQLVDRASELCREYFEVQESLNEITEDDHG